MNSSFWFVLLDILKFTIPGLIVFATVYYLFKQYNEKELRLKSLELKNRTVKNSLPIRLQAYERLSMFCERISIPNLILRLRTERMSRKEFKLALQIGIRQEYEHNISQQVYVSDNLWKIIKIAMEESNTIIANVDSTSTAETAMDFSRDLFQFLKNRESSVIDKALTAIKSEASTLF